MTKQTLDYVNGKNLDDIIDPNRLVFQRITGEEANNYVLKSTSITDVIYAGEYKAKPVKYDHAQDNSKEFWNQADSPNVLSKRIINESYNRLREAYPLQEDNASFIDDVREYEEKYAEDLECYLRENGREGYNYVGIAQGDLGPYAAAGVAIDKKGNYVLVAGENYERLRDAIADRYNATPDIAAQYIQAHEQVHGKGQKGMYENEKSPVPIERDADQTLFEYFSQRAEEENGDRYRVLARIAKDRLDRVESNYRVRSDYNSLPGIGNDYDNELTSPESYSVSGGAYSGLNVENTVPYGLSAPPVAEAYGHVAPRSLGFSAAEHSCKAY